MLDMCLLLFSLVSESFVEFISLNPKPDHAFNPPQDKSGAQSQKPELSLAWRIESLVVPLKDAINGERHDKLVDIRFAGGPLCRNETTSKVPVR
jgi:hypothetical protein